MDTKGALTVSQRTPDMRDHSSVFLLLFRKGKKNRRPSGGDFFEDGNTGIYVVFNTLSAPQAKILLYIRRFKHFSFDFCSDF